MNREVKKEKFLSEDGVAQRLASTGEYLFCLEDVASWAKVTISTVRNWIKRRQIKVVYLPGKRLIRVPCSELRKMLEDEKRKY